MIDMLKKKKIAEMRIALTTKCNSRCPYCFIEKTDVFVEYKTIRAAIRLLIESKGKKKLLSLLGGEPLLAFGTAKRAILFASRHARRYRKRLVTLICTNGLILQKKHLLFFRRHKVHVFTSLFGKKKYHDRARVLINKRGTYDLVVRKIPLILQFTPKEHAGICFCILPNTLHTLVNDFRHALNLGLRNFNLAPIMDYKPWIQKDNLLFMSGLKTILRDVITGIKTGDFIYIRPISMEIGYQKLSRHMGTYCLFEYGPYVYVDGTITLSPIVPMDTCAVANLTKHEIYRFKDCSFQPRSKKCQKCVKNYFPYLDLTKGDLRAMTVNEVYDKFCLQAARIILKKAKSDSRFAKYVRMVKMNT